ncbi:hypothetical protein [Flavobacterium sp.]|uniref:hypothetical protein n=1 Tax=Flavobacterium sp. TaxID=239 RepID=UPI00262CB9A4|nr:hypothetical protein [Flavobacterium sp.]
MRNIFLLIMLLTLSLTSIQEILASQNQNNFEKTEVCWKGKLNAKTNVFLHYQVHKSIISGYIIYLDTKTKKNIRIIGTIDETQNYRLLEFDATGNITGIISGAPKDNEFSGTWFSPKTRKELSISLKKANDNLKSEDIQASPKILAGNYHYQYGEKGYHGDLTIKNVGQNKISFDIFSVTNDPARNIAEIDKDTVYAKTDFVYKVPGDNNCEFRIQFFKDFAYITYTNSQCEGNFGHNATIEGIFYKLK